MVLCKCLTLFSAFLSISQHSPNGHMPEQQWQTTPFILHTCIILYYVRCFGWAVGGSWQLAQRCPEIGRDAWATCPFEVCNYLKNLKNRTDRILQNHTYNQLYPLFCIVLILLYPFVTAVTPWLCCMWLHVGKNVNWMKRRGRRLKKKPRKSRTHPKQSAQPENWT